MATYRVKHASVFVAGKKVATANTSDITVNSGDEVQFGDAGFAGFSDGATTTSCEVTEIVPITGTTFDFDAAIVGKQNLEMSFGLLNGNIWQVTMRAMKHDYKSDAKTGTLTGSISLAGGEPKIVSGL